MGKQVLGLSVPILTTRTTAFEVNSGQIAPKIYCFRPRKRAGNRGTQATSTQAHKHTYAHKGSGAWLCDPDSRGALVYPQQGAAV